jgi:hypothetical protein
MLNRRLNLAIAAVCLSIAGSWAALACDFCGPVNLTISEELSSAEVAIIATMTKAPEKSKDGKSELTKAVFQVDHVLKGGQNLKLDEAGAPLLVEAYYFGDAKVKTQFLLMGLDPPKIKWGSPLALSAKAVDYVRKLPKLPADGAERLEFFQAYLEDADAVLARDAYDEFAKAPYTDFCKLKPKMEREKLLKWIVDKELAISRKRLYLMMLSVCGTSADVPMLKEQLAAKPEGNEPRLGLEPVIVAYLMLAGEGGMKTVDELFMANKKATYTDIYSAIMALRFMGQEQDRISKKRILESFKHMLDRPDYADLVIPDLARWEDWSAMDRLVELFKTTKDESAWVRVPVIQYLLACPLPKAKTYIAELEKIDPESVRRANFILPLGRPGGAPKKPAPVPAPEAEGGAKGAPKAKSAATDKAVEGAAADDGSEADSVALPPPTPAAAGALAASRSGDSSADPAAGAPAPSGIRSWPVVGWITSLRPRDRWLAAAGLLSAYVVFVFFGLRRRKRHAA